MWGCLDQTLEELLRENSQYLEKYLSPTLLALSRDYFVGVHTAQSIAQLQFNFDKVGPSK